MATKNLSTEKKKLHYVKNLGRGEKTVKHKHSKKEIVGKEKVERRQRERERER